jgi:hypothetical protein
MGKKPGQGIHLLRMARLMQMEFPEIESTTIMIDAFQDDKTLLQYQQGNNIKSFYETKGFLLTQLFQVILIQFHRR